MTSVSLEKGSALRAARLHLHPPQVRCIPTAEAGGFTPGFGKNDSVRVDILIYEKRGYLLNL
jgi:hypothetical protein